MQVISYKFYDFPVGHFGIRVLLRDEFLTWRNMAYSFKLEDSKVYFLAGGVEKRLISEAPNNQQEILTVAVRYLEWWLKECHALGRFEKSHDDLKIQTNDPRGEGYFSLRTWIGTRLDAVTNLYFQYGNLQLHYLGNDENPTSELVKFIYKDREDNTEKEFIAHPPNKEEAIQTAIDYLEWRETMKVL